MRFSKSAPLKPAVRWAISVKVMFSSSFLLPGMREFTDKRQTPGFFLLGFPGISGYTREI
jgi:hypothetical protein